MAILKTQFKWTSINSTLDSKNSKTNPMIVSQSSITSDFKVQFTQEYKDTIYISEWFVKDTNFLGQDKPPYITKPEYLPIMTEFSHYYPKERLCFVQKINIFKSAKYQDLFKKS